jgi:hypothetical protein
VDGLEDYYCNCQAGFEGKVISVSNSWTLAVFKYGMRGSSTEELLKVIICKKNCIQLVHLNLLKLKTKLVDV